MEEYVLASFFITNPKSVDKIESQWKKRDSSHKFVKGRSREQAESLKNEDFGGEIWLLKIEKNQIQFIKKINCPSATGMCYDFDKKILYVGSEYKISLIESGDLKKSIDNPLFNDIHDLEINEEGDIFVVSTGIDSILKINPENPQEINWKWIATERGFDKTPSGKVRKIDEKSDYRNVSTITPEHTTHVNSCYIKNSNIISTLFHQGKIISISPNSKKHKELLSGLNCPHFVREFDNGFLVSDSRNDRVLILDKNFNEKDEIKSDFDWVQDCIQLKNKNFLIADSNNSRILIIDKSKKVESQFNFGKRKIFCFLPIEKKHAKNIFGINKK